MLLRGTAIVSSLTLLSRGLGFIRDLLVARSLGTSWLADAFLVAFRIPNLLRSFVAEGALTSAFVPVFTTALKKGESSAQNALGSIAKFLLLLTVVLSVLGFILAADVVELLAPGFAEAPERLALCAQLTRIMMPYIICISFIAMANSALNSKGVFGASAWAQVIMNVVLIAGGLLASWVAPVTATYILAWSVLLGGVAQLLAQYPACKRASLSLLPKGPLITPEVKEVIRLMIPAVVGASVYQLTIFLGTLLASLLGEGSVSWLFFADRIAQFPLGIFSIALASVLLPTLSKAAVGSDNQGFADSLAISIRYTTFVITPMSVVLWSLAHPIVILLFERGAFSSHSSMMTGAALQALSLGLWAVSFHSMVSRAFIAKRDTVTPTVVGGLTLVSNFILALVLMGPISPSDNRFIIALASIQATLTSSFLWLPMFGHVGIALASSLSAFFSLSALLLLYQVRIGNFPSATIVPTIIRTLAAAAVLLCVLQWVQRISASPLIQICGGGIIGAFAYILTHALLRSREIQEVLLAMRQLRKRDR